MPALPGRPRVQESNSGLEPTSRWPARRAPSTWPHEPPQPTGTRPRRAGAKQKKKAKARDRKERRDTRRSREIVSAKDTAAGKRQSDRSADEERTESVLLERMSTEDQLLQKQAIVYDFRQL